MMLYNEILGQKQYLKWMKFLCCAQPAGMPINARDGVTQHTFLKGLNIKN